MATHITESPAYAEAKKHYNGASEAVLMMIAATMLKNGITNAATDELDALFTVEQSEAERFYQVHPEAIEAHRKQFPDHFIESTAADEVLPEDLTSDCIQVAETEEGYVKTHIKKFFWDVRPALENEYLDLRAESEVPGYLNDERGVLVGGYVYDYDKTKRTVDITAACATCGGLIIYGVNGFYHYDPYMKNHAIIAELIKED